MLGEFRLLWCMLHPKLETVRSETSKPSLSSSPRMRGAPQVGFPATMRKISFRNSLLIRFLPKGFHYPLDSVVPELLYHRD